MFIPNSKLYILPSLICPDYAPCMRKIEACRYQAFPLEEENDGFSLCLLAVAAFPIPTDVQILGYRPITQ